MNDILQRSDFGFFLPITTRWMDNDIYGHVNNVTYYSYFDTIANTYLIDAGKLDIHDGNAIALVVNSQCNYHRAITYPEKVEGALRVNRLGTSSVEYGIGIFRSGETEACATGTFTHVFVKRDTRRPTPIPDQIRAALSELV